MLYVFVEGPDDNRFFTYLLRGLDFKIVEYANMSQKKIADYIKSIMSIPGSDYIIPIVNVKKYILFNVKSKVGILRELI